MPKRLDRAPWGGCLLAFFALVCTAYFLLTSGGEEPVVKPTAKECTVLARVPGPEDLQVDRRRGRLLISSQDRRHPSSTGAIFAAGLESGSLDAPRKLSLRGRGRCSFHPHGIYLLAGKDSPEAVSPDLLYVINHHDAADRSAARSCFPALPDEDRGVTSVEVFEVHEKYLHFQRRLAQPEILGRGNDLVALPGGEVFVTVPPGSAFEQMRDALGMGRSKVVRYRPRHGEPGGRWSEVARVGRYVNGIAHVGGRIVVTSTLDGGIYEIDPLHGRARLLGFFGMGHDNLTVLPGGDLLVASHPDLRRFLQHSRHAEAVSPARVWRFDADLGREPRLAFADDGTLLSAASTAACAGGDLILGQVFGHEVLRCPSTHCPPPETPETPETGDPT